VRVQADDLHRETYHDLHMSRAESQVLAVLWLEWCDARAALFKEHLAALQILSGLPSTHDVPHNVLAIAPPPHGAHVWARRLIGADAAATTRSRAALTAFQRVLRSDADMFARLECALLHTGRGFSAVAVARLLVRSSVTAPSTAVDRFLLCQMAAGEVGRRSFESRA
jgi:hypothetical protein